MSGTEQEWPSLVDESQDLLSGEKNSALRSLTMNASSCLNGSNSHFLAVAATASILMYGMTDVRSLARQGKLKGENVDRVLKFPFTIQDILDVVWDNKQELQAHFGEEGYKMYGSSLLPVRTELMQEDVEGKGSLTEVVAFDDENSETELVYAITVSSAKKRVTVAFRGSVTVKDWMTDADGSFRDLDNPLNPDSKEKMGIHHGFFGKSDKTCG